MNFTDKLNEMGKAGVLEKIKDAGLREYGLLNEGLYEKIVRITGSHLPVDGPMRAAAALNNHDFSGMLLNVVKEDTTKVLQGLQAIAWLVDAEEIYFYLPKEETTLKTYVEGKASALEISARVVNDIVDARRMRDGITCHFETLKMLADVLDDTYKPETLVSVVKYENSEKAVEVKAPEYIPFGTELVELVGNLEGVKAVGVGTVLCTPQEAEKLVITPETVLGDGVIRLYTAECCMVDAAQKALFASYAKSCGKCTFCREGLLQLYTRMHETAGGKGSLNGLDIMKDIGEAMNFSCSCTLGNYGSHIALETMSKFANEYQDHIRKKKCTAGSCLAFVNMYIDPDKCNGCGKCIPACADDFIEGLPGYIHMIEDVSCSKCGKCMDACPENAIVRTTGKVPRLPDRLTRVGRFKRY